jgi:CRISPR-associated protein Cas6
MTLPVDLLFPVAVRGTLPISPAHALLGALGRHLGNIHDATWLGVGPLDPRAGQLRMRLDPAHLAHVMLALRGRRLEIGPATIELGEPVLTPLAPSPTLEAHLVTIKGFEEIEPFGEACIRQLHALDAHGEIELGRRRIVRIRERAIVGYGVRLTGLVPDASLRVQAEGIGGRRRFGCGMFVG